MAKVLGPVLLKNIYYAIQHILSLCERIVQYLHVNSKLHA